MRMSAAVVSVSGAADGGGAGPPGLAVAAVTQGPVRGRRGKSRRSWWCEKRDEGAAVAIAVYESFGRGTETFLACRHTRRTAGTAISHV